MAKEKRKGQAVLEDVVAEAVLYKVFALGRCSFLNKMTITDKPLRPFTSRGKDLGLFGEYIAFSPTLNQDLTGSFSLMDAGIQDNDHNLHLTFTNEEDADVYLKWAKDNSPEYYGSSDPIYPI